MIIFSIEFYGIPETEIRKYGHKIQELLKKVDSTSKKLDIEIEFQKPDSTISLKIIECIDAFANANLGRYDNFSSLDNVNLSNSEPINNWWGNVAELILEKHYYGKAIQNKVEGDAEIIHSLMSGNFYVHYTNETGNTMHDLYSASVRTGQNKVLQKYGRYYTLLIIRWLSNLISEISDIACYKHNIGSFCRLREYFTTFLVNDDLLKSRIIWPLK